MTFALLRALTLTLCVLMRSWYVLLANFFLITAIYGYTA